MHLNLTPVREDCIRRIVAEVVEGQHCNGAGRDLWRCLAPQRVGRTLSVRSPDGKYWGNGFRPAAQPDIPRGKWICVEFMIRHNTPGKNDGEQAYWIDGELRGHWAGFNWRTSPTLFANAFTLESYVTDRWTKQAQNIVYFDNVVIAKQYIGPVGSSD